MYTAIKRQFDDIKEGYEKHGKDLDAVFVCVVFPKEKWRKAKEAGAKKDGHFGWVLWKGSVNLNGSNMASDIQSIAANYGLLTRVRYL